VESKSDPLAQSDSTMIPCSRIRAGVARDLEHVDGFVGRRTRVEIRAEPHADRAQIIDELILLEVGGAVEPHVLDEVRHSQLIVVLIDAAGIHREPELGALRRLWVSLDVVAKSVREYAHLHARVERNGVAKRGG
jgi:hypothetical protein